MSELNVLPMAQEPQTPPPAFEPRTGRLPVTVHRMDGGLEIGESEARAISTAGFPIFTPPDADRPRLIPLSDIKYIVIGSVDDAELEADPGDKSPARKAILRFRDGEWIPVYMDPSQANDGVGLAVKMRLTERQRVIPAVASSRALLEMQFVDVWSTLPEATPQRRRSDIEQAAARQGKDLHKLADDFRDRLALVRDAGLTTGDTLAFSRAVRTYLDRFLAEDGVVLSAVEKSALADIILRAAVGYGPLDPLLHDRSVSEIMVNGPDQVFIERRGVLTKSEVRFDDENQLLETIRRMVATTGRHIDGLNPMVDARLPDGSRVNAIIRPASIHGPALTIRKFKDAVLGMDDLTREGSLSPAMAQFLEAAVLGRMNILVSGGTGSGKTTSLNVIARFIPHNQRVITIEDAAELQIDHPHVIALEHRPPNVEGKGELTIRQLLRNSLRMRPDRILVGEVRGAEALDMLQAMNTGHDGSMSTIHSNSARDALSRLETMVMMASIDIPFEAVRAQIASAVNLIVHQARMPDGRRKVAQIAEVVGYDQNGAILRDIFLLGMGGDLRLEYNATGYVPSSLDKAAFYGVQVDKDLFDPVKSRFVPAGSDSMMPVVKDPLMSGQRGSGDNVVRQVVVVPFSSDRPGDRQQTHTVQSSPSSPASTMASTPEMQDEMRKLIDAARSAVADLQAAAPSGQPPEFEPPQPAAPQPASQVAQPSPQPALIAPEQRIPPPAQPASIPVEGQAPVAAGPVPPAARYPSAESSAQAAQALEAVTAMARATTELGRMTAAASTGFIANAGMLPTVQVEGGHTGAGVSRRLNAVMESIVSKKNLNLRLAHTLTQVFEGAELKASDYATPNKLSKDSAGRELRQAVEAGLLEIVKYPQGEAGYKAGPSLLKEVALGLGQTAQRQRAAHGRDHHRQPGLGADRGHGVHHVHRRRGLDAPPVDSRLHGVARDHEGVRDDRRREDHRARRPPHQGPRRRRHGQLRIDPPRRRVRARHPEGDQRLQRGQPAAPAEDQDRHQHRRGGRGGRRLLRRRCQHGSPRRRQGEGRPDPGLGGRASARRPGLGDQVLLPRPLQAEGFPGPVAPARGESRARSRRRSRSCATRSMPSSAATRRGWTSGWCSTAPRPAPAAWCCISGAPGIGTSRLASEVAADAGRKGWMVLRRLQPEQAGAPYEPFREVLARPSHGRRRAAPRRGGRQRRRSCCDLVPSLRPKLRGHAAAHEVPAEKRRELLFKGVFDLLAGRPGPPAAPGRPQRSALGRRLDGAAAARPGRAARRQQDRRASARTGTPTSTPRGRSRACSRDCCAGDAPSASRSAGLTDSRGREDARLAGAARR